MRTGRDMREEHVLASGERVVLRHVQPSDKGSLRQGFEALSPESRYRRFFGPMPTLDDATVRYLTEVDGTDHVAIVAVVESLDLKTERGVGVARFVRLADRADVAEVSVVVIDDMQNKGLGALLLSTAVVAAAERGIKRFRGEVLAENAPVMTILEEAGAKRIAERDGCVAFEVELDEGGSVLQRMLREVAAQVVTFIRSLGPPKR